MLACGSYDFLFNPLPAPLPAPDMSVDQTSFHELPLEEQLSRTKQESDHLRQTLRIKESEQEDLRHELKFHAIKNEELMDVINAFRSSSSDRSHEIMRAKAEQNSELTVQVHNLRDLLTKSGDQIAALQTELEKKTRHGEALESEKRTHQRLQVQLKGLTKTLNKVEIGTVNIPNEWINLPQWITGGFYKKEDDENSDEMIQTITQKLIAMEADRQRLLKESNVYSKSDDEKEREILDLQRQVRRMQHEKDELEASNSSLKQQLSVREGKIGALEELFQNINANRSVDGAKKASPNRRNSLFNLDDDDEDDCESVDIDSMGSPDDVFNCGAGQSFEEIFTSIWTNFTGVKAIKNDDGVSKADDEEISSCFNDTSYHTKQVEEELQAAAKKEFDELKEDHQAMTQDYEAAQFKISDLSAKLEESKIEANAFRTKADLREHLLQDVIQQYKELQMENSSANDKMVKLKQKVRVLVQLEKERHEELKKKEEAAAAVVANKGVVIKGPAVTALGEAPTFDMSERTRMISDDDSATAPSVSVANGIDKNFVMEENKRLEEECDRLQTEFDSAIDKITDLEESLEEANQEINEYLSKQADQSMTIALLEGEKATLQERVIEATTKIVNTQSTHTRATDELKLAEFKAQKAREKQLQREKDLWDVIEQYKKLADENKNTQEEKAEVEQELELTQKVKIQRRDLVYEYRKLEKDMEQAVETGEQLSKDLERAKTEAKVNKEEAKGIRKRLAGCHFQYKHLQEQYNAVLKQNEDHERRLAKAQKHEALHNSQADSWVASMESVREKRRAAEEKASQLSKENQELQQLCSRLQDEMKLLPAEV